MTTSRTMLAVLLFCVSVAGAEAQGPTSPAPKAVHAKHKTTAQTQMEQLTEKVQQLEQTVEALKQQMADREKELQAAKKKEDFIQAEEQAAAKQSRLRAESTLETVAKQSTAVSDLQKTVDDLKTSSSSAIEADKAQIVAVKAEQKALENPAVLHYMGIDLKPGGFIAGETVDRQRGIGGDINTSFSSIPFAGQTAADFSEFNGSGRQSRISLLAEGKMSHTTLRAYYETDFLSAGTTSNDNQSNSYTLRMRQAWAQAELKSGWSFTGGQMWSLATEYRSGLSNNKEATPLTIDSAYNVGFTWARQYGFRVTKTVSNKLWVGASVEEPQTLNIGGHNLPAIVYQQLGNTSGVYNSGAYYSYNYAPDLVAKIAYEPGFGHFELYGVGRFFRARVFPNAVSLNGGTASTTPTAGAYTSKTQGGGLGLNARVPLLAKRLELGAHVLAGDGIGRYSASSLSDATEHANGSLELLAGGSALGSLEWHALPHLDLYAYYGGEYVKRAYYNVTGQTTSSGQAILAGYGAPTNNVSGCHVEVAPVASANNGNNGYVAGNATNCAADNRNTQEGTFGYWYRFYKGQKGTLQQGIQYSYAVRHTWLGIGDPLTGLGGSPKAIDNMWFTSFRYYFPQ